MSIEVSTVEVEDLERMLQQMSGARSELETNLAQLHSRLAAAAETAQHMEQDIDALQARVQGLEGELEDVKSDLGRTRLERDEARRELSSLRDRIEGAMRERIIDMYHAISRQDPFKQVEQLKRSKREVLGRIHSLREDNRELHKTVEEVQSRKEDLEGLAAALRKELDSRTGQLERLEGLAGRYKKQIVDHASQVENARRDARQAGLRALIHQVTPRRLVMIMDGIDDPRGEVTPEYDAQQIVEWLVEHLMSIGVRATHRAGEVISIGEDELPAFRLDEEYRAGRMFRVTAPGLALGEDVLIQAKVRYLESEGNDELEKRGPEAAHGELPASTETAATSGERNAEDDQET